MLNHIFQTQKNQHIYIFLDIDGVLNSEVSFKYYYDQYQQDKTIELIACIDEQRLIIFHDFCECLIEKNYIPHIILSSTWRLSENLIEIIQKRFDKYHLQIENQTPYLTDSPRGLEIKAFCLENRIHKKNIIIFDDRDDMEDYKDRLIQTYDRDGLTYRDIEKALLII